MGDGYRSAVMDDLNVNAESQAYRDEEAVRIGFWPKFKRVAAKLPFAEDLVAGYYCALDRETPRHVQIALLGALAYFIFPLDVVPDMLPLVGFTDDAAILATVIKLVSSSITPIHRAAARRALDEVTR